MNEISAERRMSVSCKMFATSFMYKMKTCALKRSDVVFSPLPHSSYIHPVFLHNHFVFMYKSDLM